MGSRPAADKIRAFIVYPATERNPGMNPESILPDGPCPGPVSENLQRDLAREIDEKTSVEQCLTLARLYLKRGRELSRQDTGVLER